MIFAGYFLNIAYFCAAARRKRQKTDPFMPRPAFFLVLLLAALFALQSPAQAQSRSDEVRRFLEQRDREIKNVLGDRETFTDEQREQLKRVINNGIDFTAMGRAALGPFWADTAADEQQEFVDVFSQIVRNQSLSDLDAYRSVVTYENIAAGDETAHVTTTTVYKDIPMKVEYVLGRTNEQWQVQDIILDDVSTADGYARSFQAVVRKRGFDSLMNSLRKKLDGMRS